MKAKVNIQLLKTTTFDSGALGMMAMVLHQFHSDGHYSAAITERGRAVADVGFEVDEKSDVMQLDIDLALAARSAKARPEGCGCEVEKSSTNVVSPNGYVLFHASSGDGYAVSVSNGGGKVIFDSTMLDDGDLFAVSLLEPAKYSMANTLGSAAGEIGVTLTSDKVEQIKTLATYYVDVTADKFDAARAELTSSQGLVFRIKSTARILIQKKYPSRVVRDKPIARWQKLHMVRK